MKNWVDGKTGLYITSYILQIRFVGILKFGLLDSLVCELSIFFLNNIFGSFAEE